MLTHYPCKIAITGNTQHQLQDVLWTELDKWYRQLPDGFKSQLDIKSDKIALHGAKDSYAVCRVSRRESPESLQGFHSENMLLFVKRPLVFLILYFRLRRVVYLPRVRRLLCVVTLRGLTDIFMRPSIA